MRNSFTRKRDGSSDKNGSYDQAKRKGLRAGRQKQQGVPCGQCRKLWLVHIHSVRFSHEGVIVRVSQLL